MIEDQYFIEQLKQNNLKTLDKVYLMHKEEFYLFAGRFSISGDDILDVYQDTVISFYENVQNGKLKTLTSSLKSYLFAIGKYKIYRQMEKNKLVLSDELIIHSSPETESFEVEIGKTRQKVLKEAFDGLGSKCKKVLELYYYEGLTLDEIQEFLGYGSKDVLKSQKSRCLRQLKEFVTKRYG